MYFYFDGAIIRRYSDEMTATDSSMLIQLRDTVDAQFQQLTYKYKESADSDVIVDSKQSNFSLLTEVQQQMTIVQDSLNKRIKTASQLKAYDISVKGITMKSGGKKEEVTNRSKRVEKFKVSFTLGENAITTPGNVNLYCRLSIPDGKVLALGKGDAYTFTNEGKILQYTIKTTVPYENKAKEVVMYWNLRDGDTAVPGTYTAQIFTEDEYIGEAIVTLK